MQGCDRARRKKIDAKSADFLPQFQRLLSDGLRAAAARRVSEMDEVHAVDFQLQSIAIIPIADEGTVKPAAAAAAVRKVEHEDIVVVAHQPPQEAVSDLLAVTQRVDAASGRLFVTVPAANKADVADMFVSDNGSILLIRSASGEDSYVTLTATVDAESLTAKYSQRLKLFNLSATMKK